MKLQEFHFCNDLIINDLKDVDLKKLLEVLPEDEPLKQDLWSFGFLWPKVLQTFSTVEQLYGAIQDIYQKLYEVKEQYRFLAESYPDFNLVRNVDRGVSGSYFMVDEAGTRHYVVKPLDEDAGCIHSDGWGSPFWLSPVRSYMPLYLSSMREVLAYQISEILGCGGIVPKTTLGIIESDQFHELLDEIDPSERHRYFEYCSFADREKLCSVQEYVHGAKNLFEAIHEMEDANLTDEEIGNRFDQEDFENANLLIWTTFDTDAHMGNFLVYPKGVDEVGNEILGLKKIDNGLAFPDKNEQLRNNLVYLPNAKSPLSEEAKCKIAAIDVDLLAKQFELMGLESAIPALKSRISYLKSLANEPGITIKEINRQMTKLGKKE
jgi:hypothetical protein